MKLFHIALSLLVLSPAAASAQEVKSSVVVSYGGRNLHSDAGLNAIRTVCGAHDGSAVLEHRFAAQRCVTEKRAEVAALRDSAIAGYSAREALASR